MSQLTPRRAATDTVAVELVPGVVARLRVADSLAFRTAQTRASRLLGGAEGHDQLAAALGIDTPSLLAVVADADAAMAAADQVGLIELAVASTVEVTGLAVPPDRNFWAVVLRDIGLAGRVRAALMKDVVTWIMEGNASSASSNGAPGEGGGTAGGANWSGPPAPAGAASAPNAGTHH